MSGRGLSNTEAGPSLSVFLAQQYQLHMYNERMPIRMSMRRKEKNLFVQSINHKVQPLCTFLCIFAEKMLCCGHRNGSRDKSSTSGTPTHREEREQA